MLEIRELNATDEEIELCLEVNHRAWPDQPRSTLVNWRFQDQEWRQDKLRHQFVVTLDSRIIGFGTIVEPYWLKARDKFQFNYDLLPEHEALFLQDTSIHSLIQDYILVQLQDREAQFLLTGMREDKEVRVAWLQENHYYSTMRYPSSTLEVASFDFAPFAGYVERVERSGIAFHALAHLQRQDPDWKAKLYAIWKEIELDVPSPDSMKPVPEDEFAKVLRYPSFSPDLWVVAVDVSNASAAMPFGPYAGLTAVGAADTQPDRWHVWITGVGRAYRRRGIATAIKLTSIALARERNARCFETGNEENNPMYGINLRLGFVPKPSWHDWERALTDPGQCIMACTDIPQ